MKIFLDFRNKYSDIANCKSIIYNFEGYQDANNSKKADRTLAEDISEPANAESFRCDFRHDGGYVSVDIPYIKCGFVFIRRTRDLHQLPYYATGIYFMAA